MKKDKTNLRNYRTQKGLLQKDVADYLSIAKTTYAAYEQDAAEMDYHSLLMLSKLYGVTINQILGEDKEEAILISKSQYEKLVQASELLKEIQNGIFISEDKTKDTKKDPEHKP